MDFKLFEFVRCRSYVGLIMIFIVVENSKKMNCNFYLCFKFFKVCCRSRRIEKNFLCFFIEEWLLFIVGGGEGGFILYYLNDFFLIYFILVF